MSTTYEILGDLEDINAPAPMDDIGFLDPATEDIDEEISRLEGFQEFTRDNRGEGLTFGDL